MEVCKYIARETPEKALDLSDKKTAFPLQGAERWSKLPYGECTRIGSNATTQKARGTAVILPIHQRLCSDAQLDENCFIQ